MRLLNRTNQTLSAFLALVIVFLVMSITIYAWFSLTFSADGDLKFSTGAQNNPLKLYIGRVEPNGDEVSREFVECTPGAVITPGDYPDKYPNPFGMTEFIQGNESTLESTVKITDDGVIEFTDITIGLVDNLGEPKPENIIYLRLEIPAEHGTNLNFALSYLEETDKDGSVSHMNLYTMTEQPAADGTEKTYKIEKVTDPKTVAAMKAIEVSTDESGTLVTNSFLEYQYAVSKEKFEANQMGTLEFLDDTEKDRGIGMFDHNYIDIDSTTPYVPKGKFISESVEGVTTDATYYLYIKITPNLEAFALAFDHLPAGTCFMDFNIRARFEATDVANGSGDGNTGN